jgi:hypothetical protein
MNTPNIQKDLDDGKFYQICSNETTFKNYIYEILDSIPLEEKDNPLPEEWIGGYNCHCEEIREWKEKVIK